MAVRRASEAGDAGAHRRAHDEPPDAFDQLATAIVTHLAEVTDMPHWTVNRRADDALVVLAASPGATLRPGDRMPWGDTLSARLVGRAGPVVAGTLVGTAYARFDAPGVRAYLGTPLTDLAGHVVGSLSGVDGRRRHDLGRHLGAVQLHARSLSQLLVQQRRLDAQARSLERLHDVAETDALTGLANRRAWERVLTAEQERLDRHRTQAAVIVVDLDGLKRANDAYGHAVGDDLLRRAADALRAGTRDADAVARLGGDEFAVLLGEATSADLAEVVLRLRRVLAAADVQASLSGAVTGHHTLIEAWQLADRRMYAQKATGNPPPGGPPGRTASGAPLPPEGGR